MPTASNFELYSCSDLVFHSALWVWSFITCVNIHFVVPREDITV